MFHQGEWIGKPAPYDGVLNAVVLLSLI